MPCRPWEHDANIYAGRNVRLAGFLCDAIDILERDLKNVSDEITEELGDLGGDYIERGRDVFIMRFKQYVGDDGALWNLGDKGLEHHKLVLTRALCNAMGAVEKRGKLEQCSRELRDWWESHKKWDQRRKERGEG